MKKFLVMAAVAALMTGLAQAEVVFDLSAQHFSKSLDGKGEGARYDLPNVYVSTALKYNEGHYYSAGSSTVDFQAEMKNPLSTWSIAIDMSYYFYGKNHSIRFTSDTGKTIILSFEEYHIYLNGNLVYNDNSFCCREEVSINISKSGDTVTLDINGNGDMSKTIEVPDFSKLKYVKVAIVHDNNDDILNGLVVGTDD